MTHALGNRKGYFMSNFKNRSSFTRPNPAVEYAARPEPEPIISEVEEVESIEKVDSTPDRKFAYTTSEYGLRLREKADKVSETIETLDPKTLVEVIEFYNGEWVKVSVDLYGRTLYGYVMLEYLNLI